MRLQKHINKFEQRKDNLIKDCKYYIDLIKKNNTKKKFFYRGMDRNWWFEKRNVRNDRKPLNMSQELTSEYNKRFKTKFGKNLRTETLFVSTDKWWAKDYGFVNIIFPVGKFNYYWNPKVSDLYEDPPFWENNYLKNPLMYQEEIDEIVNGYTNKKFKTMMDNFDGEIMLDCKSYYAIGEDIENLLLDIFE